VQKNLFLVWVSTALFARKKTKDKELQMVIHTLKILPCFMNPIYEGRKTAELRKDDRFFQIGDTIILQEWDMASASFLGREIEATITYIFHGPGFGLKLGYVMLCFKVVK
jgi:hypothetical protein